MTQLDIPDRAFEVANSLAASDSSETDEALMAAAAPIIVAAELRRIADQIIAGGMDYDIRTREVRASIAMKLQGRANLLDAAGGES